MDEKPLIETEIPIDSLSNLELGEKEKSFESEQ